MSIEIRTGSDSDIPKIKQVYEILDELGVSYSPRILSAHRNTAQMLDEAKKLSKKFQVCIAAAGGSAHLPGMTASETIIPVIGIPVNTIECQGKDSLFSIMQMPEGIPTGSVGVGDAYNAGLYASQIIGLSDETIRARVRKLRGFQGMLTVKPHVAVVGKGEKVISVLEELGIDYSTYKSYDPSIEETGAQAIISVAGRIDEVAKKTDIPSIVCPVDIRGDELFSALSKVDVPLVTTGINRYKNAALFAAQIVGLSSKAVQKSLVAHRKQLMEASQQKDVQLQKKGLSF